MNWIIFTFFGAFFQNLRSSLQKKLNKDLSLIASSYVRFVFALPFATILFFSYFQNFSIISVILSNPNFIIYTFFASVLQIMFTFSLLYLFRFSNFVVGTSLSKTEVIQVAIFEYIVLNDKLNAAGIIGIIIAGFFILGQGRSQIAEASWKEEVGGRAELYEHPPLRCSGP